jgi:hypothetical protein
MSISKIRNWLYTIAKILGDINAVKRGKVGERIQRRFLGRIFGKIMDKIFRS